MAPRLMSRSLSLDGLAPVVPKGRLRLRRRLSLRTGPQPTPWAAWTLARRKPIHNDEERAKISACLRRRSYRGPGAMEAPGPLRLWEVSAQVWGDQPLSRRSHEVV